MFPTEPSSQDHVSGGSMGTLSLRLEPHAGKGQHEFLSILTLPE